MLKHFLFDRNTWGLRVVSSMLVRLYKCVQINCFILDLHMFSFQDTVEGYCLVSPSLWQNNPESLWNATAVTLPYLFHIYVIIYEVHVVFMWITECCVKLFTLGTKMHLGRSDQRLLALNTGVLMHLEYVKNRIELQQHEGRNKKDTTITVWQQFPTDEI